MLENFKNQLPVYIQLMNKIRSQILLGVYEEGEKLPSIRSIAKNTCINTATIQRAFVELEYEGLICKKRQEDLL